MDTAICPSCRERVTLTQQGMCPICNVPVGNPVPAEIASVDSLFADDNPDFGYSAPSVERSTVTSPSIPVTRGTTVQQPKPSPRRARHRSDHGDHAPSDSTTHSVVIERGLLWILFRLDGRIPRRVYWCVEVLRWLALQPMIVALEWAIDGTSDTENLAKAVLVAISFWIFLAVNVKRWHDRGNSGWWMLILFIPFLGPIWLLIELGFLQGTVGWNDYGPDPT